MTWELVREGLWHDSLGGQGTYADGGGWRGSVTISKATMVEGVERGFSTENAWKFVLRVCGQDFSLLSGKVGKWHNIPKM